MMDDDCKVSDLDIIEQIENIREEVQNRQCLVSAKLDLLNLIQIYRNSEKYTSKINQLIGSGYKFFRAVRGDGSCFYRAFIFSLFEFLCRAENSLELTRIRQLIGESRAQLLSLGMPEIGIEDFFECFVAELEFLSSKNFSLPSMIDRLTQQQISDCLVTYARFLTSAEMMLNSEDYLPYLNGKSIEQFIREEVNPVNCDAEQVQCIALTTYFGIGIRIEYLDQSPISVQHYDFPSDDHEIRFYLLYRPGHFDILYKK